MNTPIDYSSPYSFGHCCCRVKHGRRLSEFLQKYTDSGTTHLAGYNILAFKYVKISAGLPPARWVVSLPGKIECVSVKTNDVTIYVRSANL